MQNGYFYFISFLKRSPKTQTMERDSGIAENEMTTSSLVWNTIEILWANVETEETAPCLHSLLGNSEFTS